MRTKAQTTQAAPDGTVKKTAKWALRMLQNKVIGSLIMFGQGILFLISPSGDMKPTIRIGAWIVIAASLIMIIVRLARRDRGFLDYLLAGLCAAAAGVAAYFLFRPEELEPLVRFATGVITIGTGLINLIETLKIENKKDWKFIVSVLGAVAVMTLGIIMVAAQEEQIAVTQRTIGSFLMLNALANIWYIVQLHREVRKARQKAENRKGAIHRQVPKRPAGS